MQSQSLDHQGGCKIGAFFFSKAILLVCVFIYFLAALDLSCSARASLCGGFSCGAQAQLWWWCTGLVAPWHLGSSWTRNPTGVPHVGRRILNPWTTREVPQDSFLNWCPSSDSGSFILSCEFLFYKDVKLCHFSCKTLVDEFSLLICYCGKFY